MTCEHLTELEQALLRGNFGVTFRGQAWSQNCREWVYFACILQLDRIRARFDLAACVVDHEHRGTHDGQEWGLVCSKCHDGIMGLHPDEHPGAEVFPKD